jgi:hypothetical protein
MATKIPKALYFSPKRATIEVTYSHPKENEPWKS